MTYEERADHIAALIGSQLGVRGKSLDLKLQKAGRQIPRHIRDHGENIVLSVRLQASPKLARRIDNASMVKSYDICKSYFSDLDGADRRKGQLISFLSTNAFNLLVVAGLLILVLSWRGFL